MVGETLLAVSTAAEAVAQERYKYLLQREQVRDSFVSAAAVPKRRIDAVDADFTELRVDEDSIFGSSLPVKDLKDVKIRLKRKPKVVVARDGSCSVPSWGVRFPFPMGGSYHYIGEKMIQRFIALHKKARARQLTEEERRSWLSILEEADYNDYCDQVKTPLPTTGRKISSDGNVTKICMYGGREETVEGEFSRALNSVRDGQLFSVVFKRIRGKIAVFDKVEALGNA